MKFVLICFSTLYFTVEFPLVAQITFEKTLGGISRDQGYCVRQTFDGGYVVTANTSSYGAGQWDLLLTKTDSVGNIEWSKTYGSTLLEHYPWGVYQTADSGYFIAGMTLTAGINYYDGYMLKVDKNGTVQWSKVFGTVGSDYLWCGIETYNKQYVAVGYTWNFGAGETDVWVIKTDSIGDTLWTKTFGGSADEDYGHWIEENDDKGYIITGHTHSYGAGDEDVYLIRTDEDGDTLWTRAFGGTGREEGNYAIQTSDGGFIVIGTAYSFGAGQADLYLVKTDSAGNLLWSKTYGGPGMEEGYAVQETPDGGFIATGPSSSFSDGSNDFFMIKTDANGNLQFSKIYGKTGDQYSRFVETTTDGGYVLTGFCDYSGKLGYGDTDIYLVKTDSFGNSTCSTDITDSVIVSNAATLIGRGAEVGNGAEVNNSNFSEGTAGITNCNYCDSLNTVILDYSYTNSNYSFNGYDSSLNTVYQVWTFGDGSVSGFPNPVYTYQDTGIYEVCLYITSNCDAKAFCDSVIISCPLPKATFQYTDSANTVFFTNSSDTGLVWLWEYGDGDFTANQNPTHTYASEGTYWVCLTGTNQCGADTVCDSVTVCDEPLAAFQQTDSGNVVQFTNNSVNASSWQWSFGDGNFSNVANPDHSYTANGSYLSCLIATNNCASSTFCDTVNVCNPPVARFSYLDSALTITCFDSSLLASTWLWDYGDGDSSSLQSPTYTYSQEGNYALCLTVSNNCGSSIWCDSVTICNIPLSGFYYTDSNSIVQFYDSSVNVLSWLWEFGDGEFSMNQNPAHAYISEDNYWVCLIGTNQCGADTVCDTVVVCDEPMAIFQYTDSGNVVQFSNNSVNASSWQWNFGDGNFSLSKNPYHVYVQNGSYNVCLTADNSCAIHTYCDSIIIMTTAISQNVSSFTKIRYDHFTGLLLINGTESFDFESKKLLNIYNVIGQKVFGPVILQPIHKQDISLAVLGTGVFVISIVNIEGVPVVKPMKIIRF